MLLNTHSQYSLRYGTISIENLVRNAKVSGYESLAITDINNTTGVFDFIRECEDFNIKPIIGIDFRLINCQYFFALAQDREGFREMNELLSSINLGEIPLPERAPEWNHCFVIYPFESAPEKLRDYEYVGVKAEQLNKFRQSKWMKMKHGSSERWVSFFLS